jgi:phage/plasmid primase-like uncharacterized protein
MADDTSPRVYGGADETNRTPPRPEAMRGEGNPATEAPEGERTIEAEGQAVTVEETSGIAVAEGRGTTGLTRDVSASAEATPPPDA